MRYYRDFGTWQLDDLPGCSQVCVSHSAFVVPEMRQQGYGDRYHKLRLTEIEDQLYNYSIATVDSKNEGQIKILTSNGWKELDRFKSIKTGHDVIIFGRKFNV